MFYYFTALITFTFKPHTRRQQQKKKYLKSENQDISRPHTRTKKKKVSL